MDPFQSDKVTYMCKIYIHPDWKFVYQFGPFFDPSPRLVLEWFQIYMLDPRLHVLLPPTIFKANASLFMKKSLYSCRFSPWFSGWKTFSFLLLLNLHVSFPKLEFSMSRHNHALVTFICSHICEYLKAISLLSFKFTGVTMLHWHFVLLVRSKSTTKYNGYYRLLVGGLCHERLNTFCIQTDPLTIWTFVSPYRIEYREFYLFLPATMSKD